MAYTIYAYGEYTSRWLDGWGMPYAMRGLPLTPLYIRVDSRLDGHIKAIITVCLYSVAILRQG